MDGNVSKNTFSHKFFKLRFSDENTFISVQKLLVERLYLILDLYLQSWNLAINPRFFATVLKPKIVVLEPSTERKISETEFEKVFLTSQSAQIIYRCPIVLVLANYLKIAPQTIAVNLVDLLYFERENNPHESDLNLNIEIAKSGWINFYLEARSLANWLERSFLLMQTTNTFERDIRFIGQLEDTPAHLFAVQYVHARCCSLLDLAAKEGLIEFERNNRADSTWQLSQPKKIFWLDAENILWLKGWSEIKAIANLLEIADLFAQESVDWSKLAVNYSQTVAIVLSECRFLGEVRQRDPLKAIARLGLIALCRYWLEKILVEKLNVTAPTSL